MKLVTWNAHSEKPEPERLLTCLGEIDADLISLQELHGRHVEALKRLPGYELRTADDSTLGRNHNHLGVLSRLAVAAAEVVDCPGGRALSPSLLGRLKRWRECQQFLLVTVRVDGTPLTLVNVHLSAAAPPSHRLAELTAALDHLPGEGSVILCGDLNSFAAPAKNRLVGWLFGYGAADYGVDELAAIRTLAAKRGLRQVDHDEVTFPMLGQSLDHVFTRGVIVERVRVHDSAHGSDHRPIVVEFRVSGGA